MDLQSYHQVALWHHQSRRQKRPHTGFPSHNHTHTLTHRIRNVLGLSLRIYTFFFLVFFSFWFFWYDTIFSFDLTLTLSSHTLITVDVQHALSFLLFVLLYTWPGVVVSSAGKRSVKRVHTGGSGRKSAWDRED